jgi:hypothetical protein
MVPPADPPAIKLPDTPGAALPKAPGDVTVSVDTMIGRMK